MYKRQGQDRGGQVSNSGNSAIGVGGKIEILVNNFYVNCWYIRTKQINILVYSYWDLLQPICKCLFKENKYNVLL